MDRSREARSLQDTGQPRHRRRRHARRCLPYRPLPGPGTGRPGDQHELCPHGRRVLQPGRVGNRTTRVQLRPGADRPAGGRILPRPAERRHHRHRQALPRPRRRRPRLAPGAAAHRRRPAATVGPRAGALPLPDPRGAAGGHERPPGVPGDRRRGRARLAVAGVHGRAAARPARLRRRGGNRRPGNDRRGAIRGVAGGGGGGRHRGGQRPGAGVAHAGVAAAGVGGRAARHEGRRAVPEPGGRGCRARAGGEARRADRGSAAAARVGRLGQPVTDRPGAGARCGGVFLLIGGARGNRGARRHAADA